MRRAVPWLWALCTGPVVAVLLELPYGAWWAMLVYQAGCALAARLGGANLGPRPAAPGLAAAAGATATVTFLLGAGAQAAGARLAAPSLWAAWGLVPPGDLLLLALYLLGNPVLEEWFWRGALLQAAARSRRWAGARRSLAVLAFLPFHAVFLYRSFDAGVAALASLGVLLAALLWTYLREQSGTVWWSVASHLGADGGIVALYVLFLRAQAG